jgi:DNA-directed RNA polymerase sigma subunit (sigma70/sigma32)
MKRKTDEWTPAQMVALQPLLDEVRRTGVPVTLQQIGDAVGLSRMRINQIEREIIVKIKEALARRGVTA